jgi:hypothetical protein
LRAAVIDTDLGDHNCLYTEPIGALNDPHEGLALTLAESRCLFTIDRLGPPTSVQSRKRWTSTSDT